MSRQFMVLIAIVGTLGAIAVPETAQDDSTVYRVPVNGEIELGLAPVSYTHLTLPTTPNV